uniref:riboflavin kinase n=1 Tax=Amphora coffeiformis TaxID=265554 RepID=A0A7S3L497_9STRA|eukprot:scaffold5987_cov203-Amphora_coffeaeformis.AAC.5
MPALTSFRLSAFLLHGMFPWWSNLLKRTHAFGSPKRSFLTRLHNHRIMLMALSSSSSSSSSSSLDKHEDRMVARHKERISNDEADVTGPEQHLQHQKHVFDEMSDFFATQQTVPDELVPVYQHLALQIWESRPEARDEEKTTTRIMDGACGSGALFPFLLEQAVESDLPVEIVGVDVAPKMVAGAQEYASSLLRSRDDHIIQVVESDVLNFQLNEEDDRFDVVILNACFGNFWNTSAVLEHICLRLLKQKGGSVIVSHPLGSNFVEKLNREDPTTVPHLLPASSDEWSVMTRYLPLELKKMDFSFESNPYYFAWLQRVRHVALPNVMRLRGKVATGFGRGGKKLGFPTANLSPVEMRPALESVETGVYFGWAVIEGRSGIHKAVVNVGFSPTFEGKENAEKIVEAHLLFGEEEVKDFYSETMRLQLHGFLRPEIKFPSFPALIAQISEDRDEARGALDVEPSVAFSKDPFLVDSSQHWIGSTGGDDKNSWEFVETDAAIDALP